MRTNLPTLLAFALFYMSSVAQTWQLQSIGSGIKPTIDISNDGSTLITYLTETVVQGEGYIRLATIDNSNVNTETVTEGYYIGPVDLTINNSGVPAIVYHDVESNGNNPSLAGDAIVGQRLEGGWFFQDISDMGHDGRGASIVRDNDGKFQVISFDIEGGIQHSYKDSTDTWQSDIFDISNLNQQLGTSLNVDAMNRLHAAYPILGDSTLRYAIRENGIWSSEVVTQNGLFPSMNLDNNSNPIIGFYQPNVANDGSWSNDGSIIVASNDGQQWSFDMVDQLNDVDVSAQSTGRLMDIEVDPTGLIHVAYANRDVVKYAYLQNGSWTINTVADESGSNVELGQHASLTLNADGVPQVSYYERTGDSGDIMYGVSSGAFAFMPTINCPGDTTIDCTVAPIPDNTGMATSDSAMTITFSDSIVQDCPMDRIIERTWLAVTGTDSISCLQLITVSQSQLETNPLENDTLTFTGICPDDLSAMLQDSLSFECGTVVDSITMSPISMDCGRIVYGRTWSVTNPCIDSSYSIFQTIILDEVPVAVIDSQMITSDPGDSSGAISLILSCHDDSLSFNWSDGGTTQNRNGLSGGSYGLTITNQSGCQDSFSFEVMSFIRVLNCPPDTVLACGSSTMTDITGSANGMGYESISFSDQTIQDCPGDLIIQRAWIGVIDSTSADTCIQTITVLNDGISSMLEVDTMNLSGVCISEIAGMLNDSISLGCNESIDSMFMNQTMSTCGMREYTRTWLIRDDCLDSVHPVVQLVRITDIPVVRLLDTMITDDNGSMTGGISFGIDCGSDSLMYAWSNGSDSSSLVNVASGDYGLTVTDQEGCVDSFMFTIGFVAPAFSLTCPADTIINCDVILDPELTGMPVLIGFDTVTFEDSIIQGCPDDIIIQRTWTATSDTSLFTTSCVQQITVTVDSVAMVDLVDTLTFDAICFEDLGFVIEEALNLPCDVFIDSVNITFDTTACDVIELTADWRFQDQCRDTIFNRSQKILLTNPVVISLDNITTVADSGQNTGSITFDAFCKGDTTLYEWSDGSTDSIRTMLSAGDYSLTVTNQDGCVDSFSFTVISLAPTMVCPPDTVVNCDSSTDPAVTGNPDIFRFDNVTFTDSIRGGCPDDIIILRTWTASLDDTFFDTCVQMITVRADGLDNIGFEQNVTISGQCIEDVLDNLSDSINLSCNQTVDTVAVEVVSLECGSAEITQTWTITDSCLDSTVNVVQNISLTDIPVITINNSTIVGDDGNQTGSIMLDVSSCVGFALDYAWSSGDSTQSISGLSQGMYALTVTNSSGCVDSFEFDVPFTGSLAELNCPPDTSVSCLSSTDIGVTGVATGTGLDSIGFVDVVSGDCPNNTVIARTWNGYEAGVITQSCTQEITILTDALALASADSLVELSGLCIDQIADTLMTTISLSCGAQIDTIIVTINSGDCNTANLTRSIRVIDDCVGGSVTLEQTVLLSDMPGIQIENILVEPDRGDSMGSIAFDLSCTTGNPSFDWSNGSTESSLSGLSAGEYSVTITNDIGCIDSFTFDVLLIDPSDSLSMLTINTRDRSGLPLSIDSINFKNSSGANIGFELLSSSGGTALYLLEEEVENVAFICPFISDVAIGSLSVVDVIRGQRYILQLSSQCVEDGIAGDVNFSGSVSGLDLVLMRNILIGRTDGYPNNLTWTFTNSENIQVVQDMPSCVPMEAANISSRSIEIIGIKLGDYQCQE